MEVRSGSVILVGTHSPYLGEKGDAQIWGINLAYRHQPNLDRLYLMDSLPAYKECWGDEFEQNVREINALNIPLVLQGEVECFPMGRQFGYQRAFDDFSIHFYGCTAANAIADVITEGVARLVLHKMYIKGESDEYLFHRPMVGFWIGQAIACGVGIEVDENCYMHQELLHHLGRKCEMRRFRKRVGLHVEPSPPIPLPGMMADELKRRERRGEIPCRH